MTTKVDSLKKKREREEKKAEMEHLELRVCLL